MKTKRQQKIIELVREYEIETQDDLAKMLKDAGFKITQATISRDIRELKLTKVTKNDGKQKYNISTHEEGKVAEKLIKVFKEGVKSIDYAQNIIIIKTLAGMAMAVATSIDTMGNSEILGSIAGDDNIFIVVKNEQIAIKLIDKLNDTLIDQL